MNSKTKANKKRYKKKTKQNTQKTKTKCDQIKVLKNHKRRAVEILARKRETIVNKK